MGGFERVLGKMGKKKKAGTKSWTTGKKDRIQPQCQTTGTAASGSEEINML